MHHYEWDRRPPSTSFLRWGRGWATAALCVSALAAGVAGCSGEGSDEPSVPEGETSVTVHPLDTALLFPLPASAADDGLLRADSAGAHGPLLPDYARDALPALSAGKNTQLFPQLRMLAANLDPCFPSGVEGQVDATGVSQCRPQLRLIFQPVHDDGAGSPTTDDVTVHSFYEMDLGTFESMVREVVAARGSSSLGDEAIDVHPILKAEGGTGPFARALHEVILKYAGAQNLVKVTYVALRGGTIGWQLGGVDFVGQAPTDMIIAETTVTRQELLNAGGAAGDFNATVDPVTKFVGGLGVLLDSDLARTATDAEVEAGYREALELDNPATALHPGTVDCASCHLATPTRLWAERNRGMQADRFPENYVNARWNLENRSQTKEETQSMRCFGYYGSKVSISQRTINEAAAVADHINAKILGGAQ